MTAIYGHRWTAAFGELPEKETGKPTLAGDTWSRGLVGITELQIAKGLEACVVSAEGWPPALPEFRAMCFGIPSLAQVKNEISRRGKYQPFTRMVWANVDWFRFKSATADVAGFMLKDAYEIAREAVLRGEPMPLEPIASIDSPQQEKPVSAPRDVAEKYLKGLMDTLNIPGEVSCS